MTRRPEIKAVVLIDSQCTLCSRSAAFIVRHGGEKKFGFLSLYSDEGKAMLEKKGLSGDYIESIVLIEAEEVYLKSDAVLHIARKLNGLFPLLFVLKIFPRKFRDWLYDIIARHRHHFFGRERS
jgi:predicted DCC family thiol-disulfide oxidoreductase YuxK